MSNSESQIAQGSLVTKDQTNINLIWKACITIKKLHSNKIAGIGKSPNAKLSFLIFFCFVLILSLK